MSVTALIINRNRPEETKRAAESIERQSYKTKVLVWDNSELNLGVAIPSNIAVKQSKGEYILFLDNDAYLTNPNYIETMVKFLDDNPKCAVVFGRVLNTDGTDQWIKQFGVNPNIPSKCGSFNGTGCLVRNKAYLDAGGYDPLLFAYYLEADLSARLYRNNWYVQYLPITHIHEQTQKSRNNQLMLYYMTRNHYVYLIRHIPWKYAAPHILKWPVWAILKGDIALRAHGDVVKLLPRLLKERNVTNESLITKMWEKVIR